MLIPVLLALVAATGCGSSDQDGTAQEISTPQDMSGQGAPARQETPEQESSTGQGTSEQEASTPEEMPGQEAGEPESTSAQEPSGPRETPAEHEATAPQVTPERDSDRLAAVLGSASSYVEGVGQQVKIMPSAFHVDLNDDASDDRVAYNSVPPTSGDHWSAPVRCGFYIQPVPDELVVHNMEHSNIVVSYNLSEPPDIEALWGVYDGLPDLWRDHFTVVRPYSEIEEGSVALSTWGVLDIMDGVDEERITRFFKHYVGMLGPEGAISCRGS